MTVKYIFGKNQFLVLVAGSIVIAPSIHKSWYVPLRRQPDAHDKTVIVTGATGTLGAATAYEVAKRKARVIMACRDMDQCKITRREIVMTTNNYSVVCKRLNLEDLDSINEFVDDIIKNEPKIDSLVHCAGVKDLPNKEITKYGYERQFWVNFVAPYLLTLRLMDKLIEAAKDTLGSRVVTICGNPKLKWFSSLDLNDLNFEKRNYSGKTAYRQSRLAMSLFTIELERLYQKSNVYCFGFSPPDICGIMPIYNFAEKELSGSLINFFRSWTNTKAYNTCGALVMGAVDDHVMKNKPGGLYKYWLVRYGRNKGWGPLVDRELDAQVLWNKCADIILDLPTDRVNSHLVDSFEIEKSKPKLVSKEE